MKQAPSSHPTQKGLAIGDYVLTLYRHKWKIAIAVLVGVIAAGTFYFLKGNVYESQAKLLVRYVLERSVLDTEVESKVQTTKYSGGVMDAEMQILTSWDLAEEVARTVGPEKFTGDEDAVSAAAGLILKALSVSTTSQKSNVITVSYRNGDPALATEVLRSLIVSYFEKHLEIHRSADALNEINEQTDKVRMSLNSAENELNDKKSKEGILSIEDSILSLQAQIAKVDEDLMVTNADLAEQKAKVESLQGFSGTVAKPIDDSHIQKYQTAIDLLTLLRKRKVELLQSFKPNSQIVTSLERQIGAAEMQRRSLEKRFPGVAAMVAESGTANGQSPETSLRSEIARLRALEAKKEYLESEQTSFGSKVSNLTSIGTELSKLERRKKIESEKLQLLESNLEQARMDESLKTLDPSKMPNIGIVQKPSAAFLAPAVNRKIALGIIFCCTAFAVGLAFFIDLFLDRSVRRPQEIEGRLQTRLALTIPHLLKLENRGTRTSRSKKRRRKERSRRSSGSIKNDRAIELSGDRSSGKSGARRRRRHRSSSLQPWHSDHFIRPYTDTIRDRLGYYFQINQILHKPKLIGVTSVSNGVGTSTLAAGLAASCSENGYGKVLLVDMNGSQTSVHSFDAGKPVRSLPEALRSSATRARPESESHETSAEKPVENQLYLATATVGKNGSTKRIMPKEFYDLMPQFELSDFDYIVFDMPPISATTPTLSLAGFMDKVLLIVDAEHTDREDLTRAHSELVDSNADTACILNKFDAIAPKWLPGQ